MKGFELLLRIHCNFLRVVSASINCLDSEILLCPLIITFYVSKYFGILVVLSFPFLYFIIILLILLTVSDCQPQLQMMYAGSYTHMIKECNLTKVFQVRDLEELDDDWIQNNLVR